ncbi:UNVERIFIED_ORG: hypothetical protein QE415_005641 [Bacillus thuringiensis]|nr:hypothetical protein [Bacillus thuringiensis]
MFIKKLLFQLVQMFFYLFSVDKTTWEKVKKWRIICLNI